jgi:hypothetical protein
MQHCTLNVSEGNRHWRVMTSARFVRWMTLNPPIYLGRQLSLQHRCNLRETFLTECL